LKIKDNYFHLVQSAGRDHLGGESYTGSNYDFGGQVTLSHEYHSPGVSEPGYGLTTAFGYDGGGRITETRSTLHTGATHRIYCMYDDLGRLVTKQYGEGANTFTETYAYTLQGWLREQLSPYFRMQLSYDDIQTAASGQSSTPGYTGNITAWTSEHLLNGGSVNGARTNHYTYDGLNRLEDAVLYSPFSGMRTEGHTYDFNGNIQSVTENGTVRESYAYAGNRLTAMNGVGGYAYDVNGNCTAEGMSGLEFAYNSLNLIRTVKQSGTLKATYGWLADGSKTGVVTPQGNGYEYLGSLTFKRIGGLLSLEGASVDGGRIIATSAGTESLFYITDHLGSTRVVVNGNGAVEARYDYSPFGQEETDGSYPASGNRHRYNGKESQRDVGMEYLDYGWRMYNARSRRWDGIDRKAEDFYSWSPYTYCLNNPINIIDPDGRDAIYIAYPKYRANGIPFTGHAGVLLIDNKTGYTKYYEYGRYDKENKGLVRTVTISNVVIGEDGRPTTESLNKVMQQLSDKSGNKGDIEGAYIISDKFKEMNDYAKGKMSENSDPDRKPYSITGNNCATFAEDVITQDKSVDKPSSIINSPRNIVDEYQEEGNAKVQFNSKMKKTTIDEGNEKDAKLNVK
jgi:RHS repeat-associated protein